MSLESQSRRSPTSAESVIDGVVLISHCELSTDLYIFVLWKIVWSPG